MPRPARTRWQGARRHLTPVADGGHLVEGTPAVTFRTAPLGDLPLKLWEECGCDYPAPTGPKSHDPAWAQWTEEPPRTEGTKQSLRWALTRKPTRNHPGGLLGPNFYQLGHFHSGDARREQPGFPDLTIWTPLPVPNEVWELKTMDENPTLPQAHHMTSLEASGFTVRTVRPCCLLSGHVDRWLGVLSGQPATLSEWAPGLTDVERATAVRHAVRASITAAAAGAVSAPLPPAAVADQAPGRPVDDTEPGRAVAYLIPMPDGDQPAAVAELEGWLRALGFPPYTVPWPMRIVTGERVVVVWVNTGELNPGGRTWPRTWRSSYLDRPFPDHLVAPLGGDTLAAPSMHAAMSLIEPAAPSAALPEETR